eukprot:Platyproteum_vivax@DN2649_c0_g1_i2.p1
MLPVFLISVGIFLVGVLLPAIFSLHYALENNYEKMNLWLFYWLLYVILDCVLYVAEPILCSIFALSPIDLYWEAKLALYCFLAIPSCGGLLMCYQFFQANFEAYAHIATEKVHDVVGQIQDTIRNTLSSAPAATTPTK